MALVRFVLFCIFFAVGASAISLSILVEEILQQGGNIFLLEEIQADNEKIESLTVDYESQIEQIKNNPEALQRLKQITIGSRPEAEDTAFPRLSEQELAMATKALMAELGETNRQPNHPEWLVRCSGVKERKTLFFTGAGLILVAFIFFGTPRVRPMPADA